MSSHINVCVVGGAPMPIAVERTVGAVRSRWGTDSVTTVSGISDQLACVVRVRDDGGPFRIEIDADLSRVGADGTPAQNEVVACLVRSTMPADAPRIIAFDGSWGWHAELVAGITPQTFADHVVIHDEHWVDPDLQI